MLFRNFMIGYSKICYPVPKQIAMRLLLFFTR